MDRRTWLIVLTVVLWTSLAAAEPVDTSGPERPSPWTHIQQRVALAGWPAGLLGETLIQPRVSLHRAESMVLNETYAGAGGRLRITPAFVDVGPRLSLAPFDFFDVNAQGSFLYYWPSSSGLLPYDDITESTRDLDREDRWKDPATAPKGSWAFALTVDPTLKLKFGPVIAFSGWTFAWYWIDQPDGIDSNLVYEPYFDRLIEWNDLVVEHQAAVIVELFDGDAKPLLWLGATYRQHWAIGSKDASINVGGLFAVRPSYRRGWPLIIGQVLPYVKDPDRVGGMPSLVLLLSWSNDHPGPRWAQGS